MKEPIVFGKHSIEDAQRLWEESQSVNPMVNKHGGGPENTLCSTCTFLKDRGPGTRPICLKTDAKQHGTFWPACGLFEARRK